MSEKLTIDELNASSSLNPSETANVSVMSEFRIPSYHASELYKSTVTHPCYIAGKDICEYLIMFHLFRFQIKCISTNPLYSLLICHGGSTVSTRMVLLATFNWLETAGLQFWASLEPLCSGFAVHHI